MATEVASIFAKIDADLSGFHRGMGQFDKSVKNAGDGFRNFTTGIVQGIGQAFGHAALSAIRSFGETLVGVVAASADMEQAVADISATMGLTAEETAKVDALISDLGIDPKLKVSATEAAAAVEMLGKNGLKLDEILGGAARSTVLLANSTGADFSTAADVATSAMAQFKIRAEDMSGAVDQITGVTRNSKFDIDDYRLAISQAGGVAASVGVDFTDFNATIAAIAPSFSGGSSAGTSFKVFLQRLVPDTEPAKEAMRQLGILTEDGGNKFFTASGEMRSMSEIAEVLQQAFGGLSEAQRIQTATNIFGTDAMVAAFALADSGVGTIDRLKETIGNTSAEDSAATRMDTLSGAWETFLGVVESLSIQFGKAFLPALRTVVEGLTDLAVNAGPKIDEWGKMIGDRLSLIADAAVELLNLGIDKGLAAIFAPLPDGTRELDKLWESFGMTKDQAKETSDTLIEMTIAIKDIVVAVGSFVKGVAEVVVPLVSWIDKTIGLDNVLRGLAVLMAGSFVASIVSTVTTIVGAVTSVGTFVASLTGLGTVATTIGGAIVAAISAIGGPITIIVAAIGALALAWHNNWWDIRGKTEAAWEAIKGFVSSGVDAVKRFILEGGWKTVGQNMMQGLVDGIKGAWNWVKDAATGAAEAAKNAAETALGIGSPSKEFERIGNFVMEGFGVGLENSDSASNALRDSLKDVQSSATAYVDRDFSSSMADAARNVLRHFTDGAKEKRGAVSALSDSLKSIRESADAITAEMAIGMFGAARNAMASFSRGLSAALSDIGGVMAELSRKMKDGSNAAADNIMLGLVNGIRDRMRWLTDIAGDLARAVLDPIKNALGIHSESTVFKELGHWIAVGFGHGVEENTNVMDELSKEMAHGANIIAENVMMAFTNGLRSRTIWLASIAKDLAQTIIDTISQKLNIGVFEAIGKQITAGLALGIGNNLNMPQISTSRLVQHTVGIAGSSMVSDASNMPRRIDVTIRGESSIPSDKVALRNLARALQQEFIMSGARVIVT